MSKTPNQLGESENITILLVDDIPETRENIKKMLDFERDFKVVDTAGTGREGVEKAKEHKPNIVIMDINMPDMDGIQATKLINEAVPTAAVIMMSVQNDPDYMRRAMLAGARNFLTKPISMDELYSTIRTVHERYKSLAAQYAAAAQVSDLRQTMKSKSEGDRPGHIVLVYSPQGGAGTTTIATSLASGLMKEGIRVLLVDADLQFGDIQAILNLPTKSTMVDLVEEVEDLDIDLFENTLLTHDSGLKVLLGPARPEFAEPILSRPQALAEILQKVSGNYDFIVVDTATTLDEVLLALMDVATKIILVGVPTLTCVKNIRFVLDLFDKLSYPPDKAMLILNRVPEDRNLRRITIAPERIEQYLRRPIVARIPTDELFMLRAIQKAVPAVALERDKSRSPIRELMEFSNHVFNHLTGAHQQEQSEQPRERERERRIGVFSSRINR
ncbi:MAG: response regulator [Aggregatilineales bacterium]